MRDMSASTPLAAAITESLEAALGQTAALDAGLDQLLRATGGRAAGLWMIDGDTLRQLGFRAVDDMPLDVRTEFAAATQSVPVSETGLGIVKAVVSAAPAMATVEGVAGLGASAGWLERFACQASLAVPVEHDGQVVGVLAISTPGSLVADTPARAVLLDVAARLGRSVADRRA